MDKKIILGIGTGRCGTVSLTSLLNNQKDTCFSHELRIKKESVQDYNIPLPWEKDEDALNRALISIQNYNGKIVGDISFFWLPYLEVLFRKFKNLKVICLQRDKKDVVKSYLHKTKGRNHWIEHDGSNWDYCDWDRSYPKYQTDSKEKALTIYWQKYYEKVEELIKIFPNRIKIFQTIDLNKESKITEILDYLDFETKNILVSIAQNKKETALQKIKRFMLGKYPIFL